jgi:pyruvate/2-oxoglutarate dehydrogenase complex dihydrolipoamide dehydrogenase (E3) component
MINPEAGRELEWRVERAPEPKRVLVAGAGPAGLEAATTAARRGHRVTLVEQADFIGGMVALGSKPPSKAELKNIVDYYQAELRRTGVQVKLGRRVTPEMVREMAPDVVVAATGSVPVVPPILGIDGPNVVQAREVLLDRATLGHSAVVIGGGDVGCETAEYLRARGLEVTVLEMLGQLAHGMEPVTRLVFLPRLEASGVRLIANARVVRIEGNRVVYADPEGRESSVEGETIVLALGGRPDRALLEALKPLGVPVVAVGDCQEPRRIVEAIYEGGLAGRTI